jgi:branched-chain amino acid transport system ATP-binding protein
LIDPILASPGRTDREPLLQAVSLAAGYRSVPVVTDIDLRVHPGEVVALLGANGAGKSTTMMALAGVIKPLSGAVNWLGHSANLPLHVRARRGLAYVPEQRSTISSLTTQENLRLGRGPIERAVELFPELGPLMARRAGLLSGGEQQILTLARALAVGPRLLLADELSLGLAPLVVGRLLEAIRVAADRGVGILLVEQQIRNALEIADSAVVLRRGKIVMQGPAKDITGRLDELKAMYLTADL